MIFNTIARMIRGCGLRGKVTVGTFGSSAGFQESSYGSITPGQFVDPVGGHAVAQLSAFSGGGGVDLILRLGQYESDPGASVISRIVIQDGDGDARTYLSSAATYAYLSASDIAQWQWGDGSDPSYTSGDSAEVRPFVIIP